ncbi:MAG: adenine phosphoribosyltransferase [Epsilonproteobacteria bacterium]|nr:adenine phosphoribosyltransferase [Campylobacterota bacterium]NPA89520.1 adenine phosphoribosyltransferase [Campylobacterota bacterium]
MGMPGEELRQKLAEKVKAKIKDVPDFPKPGIIFKDITPVLGDGKLFREIIDFWADHYRGKIDFVAGIESRGFIFGAPLASQLGVGFVPIRKKGKLPGETFQVSYGLEYGSDQLEIKRDAFKGSPSHRVLIVDDLLATGGTARAGVELVRRAGGTVIGLQFLVNLSFLPGAELLERSNLPFDWLVSY